MHSKLLAEIWCLSSRYDFLMLELIIITDSALKRIKELLLKSKEILNELREASVEELKTDETFSDTICFTHRMIFDLERIIWDDELDLRFKLSDKAEFKKSARELHKNVQKIYLILTENLSLDDKKKFIKERIRMIKTDGELNQARVSLYIGKELARKKFCSKNEPKSFIPLKENALIEKIMETVSAKDPANEFDYVTFFEEVEHNLEEDNPEWRKLKASLGIA